MTNKLRVCVVCGKPARYTTPEPTCNSGYRAYRLYGDTRHNEGIRRPSRWGRKSDGSGSERAYQARRTASIRRWMAAVKTTAGCSNCGYSRCSAALEWHHIGDKQGDLARLVARGTALVKLCNEMEECVLLCANCHREAHHYSKT